MNEFFVKKKNEWIFFTKLTLLHILLKENDISLEKQHQEFFKTQLTSFNCMIYLFTSYFSATPPWIVTNSAL